MIVRDDGGYVGQIQIGTKVYTGEEVQYALGLPSPSYTLEEYDGGIRAVCQGSATVTGSASTVLSAWRRRENSGRDS